VSLLDERQRRLFGGLESLRLGWGGDREVAEAIGLDHSTGLMEEDSDIVAGGPFLL
jgi:hypothetical protein